MLIENVQVKQQRLISVLVQNRKAIEIYGRYFDIAPAIFRSMTYMCYVHITISGPKFWMGSLPIWTPKGLNEQAVYKRALIIIIVRKHPRKMSYYTIDYEDMIKMEHRVFMYRIMLKGDGFHRKIVFSKAYFLCVFCEPGIVYIGDKNVDLSTDISNFKHRWKYATHYWQRDFLEKISDEVCNERTITSLSSISNKCHAAQAVTQLIFHSYDKNLTVVIWDYRGNPKISYPDTRTDPSDYIHTKPDIETYERPIIMYCDYGGAFLVAQRDMWNKNVSTVVWVALAITILVLAVLSILRDSNSYLGRSLLSILLLYLNNVVQLMRAFIRQGAAHKWILLAFIEIMVNIMLTAYENYITVNVVVPLVPKPYSNTKQIFDNNYYFTLNGKSKVCTDIFPTPPCENYVKYRADTWLQNEYNTVNHEKVFEISKYEFSHKWIYNLLKKNETGKKHAVVGTSQNGDNFYFVEQTIGKMYSCYKIFPTDKAFNEYPILISFESAISSQLIRKMKVLKASGVLTAIELVTQFNRKIKANAELKRLRSSGKLLNYKGQDFSNFLTNNLITLQHGTRPCMLGITVIIVSVVIFMLEFAYLRVDFTLKIKIKLKPLNNKYQRQNHIALSNDE